MFENSLTEITFSIQSDLESFFRCQVKYDNIADDIFFTVINQSVSHVDHPF